MAELRITTENFEAEVLNSALPVLVDFYADWCGPCKMLAPTVAELAEERGFEVRGIEDGELRLYAKGKLAVRIYEDGGGSYVSPLVSKDDSQKEIVFSTPVGNRSRN